MSDLTALDPRDLINQPHLMAPTIHRIEKVIEAAAALERWDELQKAIDFLIECQAVILAWWKANVPLGRPKVSQERGKLNNREAQDLIGFSDSRLGRWRAEHLDLDSYREKVATAARRKAELDATPNRVSPNTGEFEWYTPAEYIEAARAVMGAIDLDPASSLRAQETVQALHYFTADDDGLARDWYGRVWLNPPYSQPLIGNFIDKLGQELTAGHVDQAIMVTNNCTDTEWFHSAVKHANLLCFTRGRIRFTNPDKPAGESPLQGQCFFYHGPDLQAFATTFSAFGFITEPWRAP